MIVVMVVHSKWCRGLIAVCLAFGFALAPVGIAAANSYSTRTHTGTVRGRVDSGDIGNRRLRGVISAVYLGAKYSGGPNAGVHGTMQLGLSPAFWMQFAGYAPLPVPSFVRRSPYFAEGSFLLVRNRVERVMVDFVVAEQSWESDGYVHRNQNIVQVPTRQRSMAGFRLGARYMDSRGPVYDDTGLEYVDRLGAVDIFAGGIWTHAIDTVADISGYGRFASQRWQQISADLSYSAVRFGTEGEPESSRNLGWRVFMAISTGSNSGVAMVGELGQRPAKGGTYAMVGVGVGFAAGDF